MNDVDLTLLRKQNKELKEELERLREYVQLLEYEVGYIDFNKFEL